jgi:hypothetical protein
MRESIIIEKPNLIEQQANSKENPTLLLLSRLKNPEIFEQIISMYEGYYINEGFDTNDLKETISLKLKKRIQAIEKSTPIDINPKEGDQISIGGYGEDLIFSKRISREKIKTPLMLKDFRFDPQKSTIIQSITESHEKGHIIRLFVDDYFRTYFNSGFDINASKYNREKTRELIAIYKGIVPTEKDIDTAINECNDYLFSGHEIAERMSQLKAYFGMKGSEKFTLDHLYYAREHYIKDTGFDNNMNIFFSAITKATESKFIELINSSGI